MKYFQNLNKLIVKYILNKENREFENRPLFIKDVSFIYDVNSFNNNCYDHQRPCIISLLDGRTNNQSMMEFERNFKVLDKLISNEELKLLSFSWVNSTCNVYKLLIKTNITKKLSVESLPNIIVFYPNRNVSSNFIGSFTEKSILKFLKNLAKGKTIYNQNITITQDDFSNKNCDQIREYINHGKLYIT